VAQQQLVNRLREIAADRDRACATDDLARAAALDEEYERIADQLSLARSPKFLSWPDQRVVQSYSGCLTLSCSLTKTSAWSSPTARRSSLLSVPSQQMRGVAFTRLIPESNVNLLPGDFHNRRLRVVEISLPSSARSRGARTVSITAVRCARRLARRQSGRNARPWQYVAAGAMLGASAILIGAAILRRW
jgi:hypothetical protein